MKFSAVCSVAIGLLLTMTAGAGQARDVVIHAGTLFDGVADSPRTQVSILVRDDRIVSIESGFAAPAGAEIIDLSTATVMPGFIDCHVHISSMLPSRTNATEYWLTHSDIDRALDAAVFIRQMLQQGFTSARDVGGGNDTVSVRDAIDAGKIPGPRLWVSLEPLGPTAGHGDPKKRHGPRNLSHPGWDHRGVVEFARSGAPAGPRASRPAAPT